MSCSMSIERVRQTRTGRREGRDTRNETYRKANKQTDKQTGQCWGHSFSPATVILFIYVKNGRRQHAVCIAAVMLILRSRKSRNAQWSVDKECLHSAAYTEGRLRAVKVVKIDAWRNVALHEQWRFVILPRRFPRIPPSSTPWAPLLKSKKNLLIISIYGSRLTTGNQGE